MVKVGKAHVGLPWRAEVKSLCFHCSGRGFNTRSGD